MAQNSQTVREITNEEKLAVEDRRHERRIQCNLDLRVANYDGVMQPERMDYLAMQSRDISSTGISYFSPKPPDADTLVLMVGAYADAYYVTAQVVRCQEGFWNRRRQYIVGCVFDGQIPAPC
jgi:hypothetical protein